MTSFLSKWRRSVLRRRRYVGRVALLGATCIALAVGACGGSAPPVDEPAPVYVLATEFDFGYVCAPEEVQFGATYAGWSARWWEWVYETPFTNHPLFDKTGASAGEGQVDPVWFLGPIYGTLAEPTDGTVVRNITIPGGVALFFPIFCVGIDNQTCQEPDGTFSFTDLRGLASEAVHQVRDVVLVMDGVEVIRSFGLDGAARFRAQAPEFEAEIPDDNINVGTCGDPPIGGRFGPIASDGIFMMVAPMPTGAHTVQFTANDNSGGPPVNVTYNITVQ